MPENVNINAADLREFSAAVLRQVGVAAAEAAIVADCMVFAHLRGFDTHGFPCLAGYAECLEQGRINPHPKIAIERPAPWTVRLDADNGLGHVAAVRAMERALETAERSGVGAAVVRRSNHFGAASCYSMMALPKDCIGIVSSNASAVTAPFGAVEPFLGTNPLSVAVPTLKLPPFVIDMATSEGARKKVRKLLSEGLPLPAGWALDKQGNPTTDPKTALEGVMLPFGGMKGSAVTLLLDILSGVLSGAEFGGRVLSVLTNQEKESGNGNFMLVFKAASFLPAEEFKARMDEELSRLRSLRPATGVSEVIYPGYKEHFLESGRRENGIPFSTALMKEAQSLSKRYDVAFPA
jgi:LDH2 family malate/lactate/ureidoglycolate dehydrogenase